MGHDRKYTPYIDMEINGDKIHIGAYIGGVEVGFLDADVKDDQILITCLYVVEEYRRQYVASDILDELVDYLYVEELHIPLSMDYILEEGLEDLHAFMSGREDFLLISDGEEYVVPNDVWGNCFGSKQIERMASTGIRIDELLSGQRNMAVAALREEGLYLVPEGETLTDVYDSDLSYMAFSDDEFKAGLLARIVTDYKGEEMIELSVVICKPGSELWMMKLLSGFLSNMKKKYPDHSIRIFGVNEGSINLVEKFFEKKAITKPGYSAIWLGI